MRGHAEHPRDVAVGIGVILVPRHARGHRGDLADAHPVIGGACQRGDDVGDRRIDAGDRAIRDCRPQQGRGKALGDREAGPPPGRAETQTVILEHDRTVLEDHDTGRLRFGHIGTDIRLQRGGHAAFLPRQRADRIGRRHFEPGEGRFHIAERGRAARVVPEQDRIARIQARHLRGHRLGYRRRCRGCGCDGVVSRRATRQRQGRHRNQ